MNLGPPLSPRREGLSDPPSHVLPAMALAAAGEEEYVMNLGPPLLPRREGLSGPPCHVLSAMTLAAAGEGENEVLDTSLESSIDQVTNGTHLYSLLRAHTMHLAFGCLMLKSRPKTMTLNLPSIVVRSPAICTGWTRS